MSEITVEHSELCTFKIGDLLLGVDVQRVQEVIRELPLTRVPLARPAVLGLVNLRGHIVCALELRFRLGLPRRSDGKSSMMVVVNSSDGPVSLLVDEIGDVVSVADVDWEDPPSTMDPSVANLIRRAYKLDTQLLLLLDIDAVLAD
jgi:purine-binding chemotaxis protein CheW